jgi:hypothetical protein
MAPNKVRAQLKVHHSSQLHLQEWYSRGTAKRRFCFRSMATAFAVFLLYC